jgi:hypothetical protein
MRLKFCLPAIIGCCTLLISCEGEDVELKGQWQGAKRTLEGSFAALPEKCVDGGKECKVGETRDRDIYVFPIWPYVFRYYIRDTIHVAYASRQGYIDAITNAYHERTLHELSQQSDYLPVFALHPNRKEFIDSIDKGHYQLMRIGDMEGVAVFAKKPDNDSSFVVYETDIFEPEK